jgi:uncharacterized protein YdeI (YjbR/CyaY-like superfamily)
MEPTFFRKASTFRSWLQKNHLTSRELLVGYYKVGSGKPSMTWPESVDEALCFGWIDGVRKSLDEQSYSIRFTPRKPKSIWSSVNIKRIEVLKAEGRIQTAGLAAFERRTETKSSIYSYEQRDVVLPEPYNGKLNENKRASKFFKGQNASYRKAACWWVVSAKKEETQLRRLRILIELSEKNALIPQFIPSKSNTNNRASKDTSKGTSKGKSKGAGKNVTL